MYKNRLHRLLEPFSFFKHGSEKYSVILKEYKDDLDKWKYDKIKLKPIRKFLIDNGVAKYTDINHYQQREEVFYPFIYTTAISKSWFDLGKYNFYLNGKHISEYDEKLLKVLHHQGYIYLCFREDFEITSLMVFRTNITTSVEKLHDYITIKDKDNKLEIPYNNKFKFEKNEHNGLKLVINLPYIKIKQNENIFSVLSKWVDDPINWLYNNKILSYLFINDDKGIVPDSDDIVMDNMFFSVKRDSKDTLFLFYQGTDPEEYEEKLLDNFHDNVPGYLENTYDILFKNENTKNYLIEHPDLLIQDDEINVFKEFPNYTELTSANISDYLLGYSYDLFMECYKINHKTKYNFTYDDFVKVTETKFSEYDYDDNQYVDQQLLKFTFRNYANNPFEIYIFGKLYTSTYITDRHGFYTSVYFNRTTLCDELGISLDQLKNIVGCVLIKNHDYKRINYSNITYETNGCLPISQDWFTIDNKKIFDNGYRLKNTDIDINTIRPSGLLCAYPKRIFKKHSISIIGNRISSTKILSNTYKVKVRNYLSTELDNFMDPNKIIYKNIMYTDYIDYRFNIYCGPYLLMENYDYRILAPNVIEFLKPLPVYLEDYNKSDYIDLTIEYEGELEDILLKIYKNKSYLYRLFNNKDFMKEYMKDRLGSKTISNRDWILGINEKGLYDNKIFRFNQMITKYFSCERLLTAEENKYGDKFYEEIRSEFPEFITKVNDNYLINTQLEIPSYENIPRRIRLPEFIDLNELIEKHFKSVKILQFEDKTFDKEYKIEKQFYRYKSDLYKDDLLISPNIPINYLIDQY